MKSALDAAGDVKVSPEEAWSEVERERQVRNRVYEKWVEEGKLSWADARDRYARIVSASAMLKAIIELSPDDREILEGKGIPF